jgi:hypothetical protein
VIDLEAQLRAIAREEAALLIAERAPAAGDKLFVTIAEYARVRSISETTVRAAIRAGRLQPYEVVGMRGVRLKATDEIVRPARAAGPENDNRAAAAAARADRRLGGR